MAEKSELTGLFFEQLSRSESEIIRGRSARLNKSTMNAYLNRLNEQSNLIEGYKDEQELILDNSPDNRYSLLVGKDFKAEDFVKKDTELTDKIYIEERRLQLMVERFVKLFGKGNLPVSLIAKE